MGSRPKKRKKNLLRMIIAFSFSMNKVLLVVVVLYVH